MALRDEGKRIPKSLTTLRPEEPVATKDELKLVPKGLTSLRAEDHEALIQKLTEILVLDYQCNQQVPEPTVKTGTRRNRGLYRVDRGKS